MNALTKLLQMLPPWARLALYVLAALALVGYAAWQASGGDWVQTVVAVVLAIVNTISASNVDFADKE
ncbi:MAG TPA: hypothetical protein VIP28_00140 [Nocardioides sp.]|jgi:multidrug efflux pump subunit AcrA (membrane-fusion protein)